MRSFDNDEKQIIEKLRKLPNIYDHTDKDALFERISQQIDEKPIRSVQNRKLIPILSTAFVIALFLIIVPSIMNTNHFSEINDDYSTKESMDKSADMEIQQDNPSVNNKMDTNEIKTFETEQNEENSTQNHMDEEVEHVESYVISSVNNNQRIVYGAVADNQVQYVVPVSFVVSNEIEIDTYYNELGSHLLESEWGVSDYPFDHVTFDIDQEKAQVSMNLPENFNIGDGSSIPSMFSKILSVMFRPYGIERVIFETENGQGVDLGPYGTRNELPLDKVTKANYKIYQASEQSKKFLIPIPREEGTIEEALIDLKNSNEDFNVYQTIPENINFTVEEENNQLSITFSEKVESIDPHKGVTMIEAILMTAKSYGYETVRFGNLVVEHIGPYDVTNPIHVPEAVNPID